MDSLIKSGKYAGKEASQLAEAWRQIQNAIEDSTLATEDLTTKMAELLKLTDKDVKLNKNAKLIHKINLPAKNITNCAFGGQNNNELFITSATKGMNKAGLQKFRYSGFLFSVKTNSKGILQKKFILSNEKKRSLL